MVVKRKWDLVGCTTSKGNRNANGEVDDPNNLLHGNTLFELPLDIFLKILLKLPVEAVLTCKCVCKSWLSAVSSPHFGQLYSESAPISVLVRTNSYRHVSRTLHLLNFDKLGGDEDHKNSLGDNKLGGVCSCRDFVRPNCDGHMNLVFKLKLPLRDAKMVVHTKHEAKTRGRIIFQPNGNKFIIANSCNGLLCLYSKYNSIVIPKSLVVCNPINGEFMRLPQSENSKLRRYAFDYHGLGYLKKTDEYKVISIYTSTISGPVVVEIHTLGTKLWRNIEYGKFWNRILSPTCLNGSLHWLVFNLVEVSILCFDLETEEPKSFGCPSALYSLGLRCLYHMSLGEVKGSLFISGPFENKTLLKFWTMKKYGVSESWTEIFRFNVNVLQNWPCLFRTKIAFLRQGFLICQGRFFIYYDPLRNLVRFFEGRGTSSTALEPVLFSPNLMRLKDVVKHGDIEVRNVYSWCGIFKLHEEEEILYMAKYKADLDDKDMKLQSF